MFFKNMFLSNMRSLYMLLCVAMQSLATLGCMHIYKCTTYLYTNQAGGLDKSRWRGFCRKKFAQDFSFKVHLFLQNVLQSYASHIYRHLFETFHYPIRHRSCFHHRAAFIIRYPFGKSWGFQMIDY
jgi:hypothetical protein